MSQIGVGIVGTGWVSGEHIKSYQKHASTQVVALCNPNRASAERRAEAAGLKDVKIYTNYAEMVADPDIQAISICSPPNNHPQETILAAEAGKHLLIEKAVANDPVSLGKMARAVDTAGVRTVVSFVLHWNLQFLWIKRMLEEQTIGDIFYAEVDYWHNIGPQYVQFHWNKHKHIAGSVLLSAGCHAIDAMRHFVGSEVVEVSAYSNKRNDVYEYDTNLVGIMKFANGAIGKTCASFDCKNPYLFNIDLLGEKGTIRDNKIWATEYFGGQTDWVSVPTIRPDSGDVSHHPFDGEIAHFVDCIEQGKESFINLADAAKTHAVCYAMDRSAEQGRTVSLAEIDAEIAGA